MAPRKTKPFSVVKAVKANARERVGTPPAARVVKSEPRQGREAKYKPTLSTELREE